MNRNQYKATLQHMRTYAVSLRDKDEPYFPNGRGKYLNIRQIVRGAERHTDLGEKCIAAWFKMNSKVLARPA